MESRGRVLVCFKKKPGFLIGKLSYKTVYLKLQVSELYKHKPNE